MPLLNGSLLDLYNFDRWTYPLIDWQRLAWPAAKMALPMQVSVLWLFTAV